MDNGDDDHPTLTTGERIAMTGPQLGAGTDVGGYVIDGELGIGGVGVVYSATHPLIGKRAAIKVLRPELSNDPTAVERFVAEARLVNEVGHPNIVDIFAFGTLPDGRHYYVMDLLHGETLRARLRRTGVLHVSEAASIIDETASALAAAHAKGIIHRDLKPDNVFMVSIPGRWPEVKLLDWGVAKLLGPAAKFRTATGSMLGTPVYMSPEQARGADSVDERTDIYALGVMAYELLAGETPFRRRTSIDTILAHQEDQVPPLGVRVPGLPEELVQLIHAMLAKERDDRPTLGAVRAVLKRLRGSKIPTMTAAGLAMELPPLPVTTIEDPDEDARTIDHEPPMAITSRELPSASAFHVSAPLPLPAPLDTPSGGAVPMFITPPPGSRFNTPRPPAAPAVAMSSQRWIVILAVAIVVTGLGIVLLLLA